MRNFSGTVILTLFSAFGLAGCSVKSDRTDCPCELNLRITGGEEGFANVSLWDVGPRTRMDEKVRCGGAAVQLKVPRGDFFISTWNGRHACTETSSCIMIPEGCEMDPVFASSGSIDSRCERLSSEVVIHKQFAYLNIVVTGAGESSYSLLVRGNVCGMRIPDMMPVPGLFSVTLYPLLGDSFRVCIPRQTDGSLELVLQEAVFPIGRIIEEAGYNWSAEDLDDIDISIDYITMGVSVGIAPWTIITI